MNVAPIGVSAQNGVKPADYQYAQRPEAAGTLAFGSGSETAGSLASGSTFDVMA